jgi:transcriptional regulator with XRE-family HTH domain
MNVERFPDNLNRLLGMHDLTDREAAEILGMSQSTLGKWQTRMRRPSFAMALRVGEFFGVQADRLATASFTDLLQHELADPARFEAVEARIHRLRTGLKAVEDPGAGKKVDVATGKPGKRKKER